MSCRSQLYGLHTPGSGRFNIDYRQSSLSIGSSQTILAGDRLPWLTLGTENNYQPLKLCCWQVHVYRTCERIHYMDFPLFCFPSIGKHHGTKLNTSKLYFIRPDGYIALIFDEVDDRLREYLKRWGLEPSGNDISTAPSKAPLAEAAAYTEIGKLCS